MVLLVKSSDGKHENYYDGDHIAFHEESRETGLYLVVVIESKGRQTSVESSWGTGNEFYLMNKSGKTIKTRIS